MRKKFYTCFYRISTAVLACLLVFTPAGSCLYAQFPGGVSSSLTAWFKANSVTAGNILPNQNNNTAVSEWESELGNLSVTQSTTTKMPLFIAAASANNNFNPKAGKSDQ